MVREVQEPMENENYTEMKIIIIIICLAGEVSLQHHAHTA